MEIKKRTPTADETFLRSLLDLRDRALQKNRIAFGNRIDAIMRGSDEADHAHLAFFRRWYERFLDLEREANDDLKSFLNEFDHPFLPYLTAVKGIGPIMAAKLIVMIDPYRAPTVSALWRHAGYGVRDGKRERHRKGEKSSFNQRLKIAVRLCGEQFLRHGTPYADLYYSAKEKYETTKPDWTDMHIHNAALGKMVKIFLSHLWEVWRELEGLPVRKPYAHEHLGHESYHNPYNFGWPEITSRDDGSDPN